MCAPGVEIYCVPRHSVVAHIEMWPRPQLARFEIASHPQIAASTAPHKGGGKKKPCLCPCRAFKPLHPFPRQETGLGPTRLGLAQPRVRDGGREVYCNVLTYAYL